MEIELVSVNAVRPATWRVNYVLRTDLKLLKASMLDYGWLKPIVVRSEDSTIIDGFHRWLVASNNESLGLVPVVWVSCDEIEAMIMHVRLNRARGGISNQKLSKLLRRVLRSRKYDSEQVREAFGMSMDEFDVLSDGTLIKVRKIPKHKFSNAWVPVETKGREKAQPMSIERPPTPDK